MSPSEINSIRCGRVKLGRGTFRELPSLIEEISPHMVGFVIDSEVNRRWREKLAEVIPSRSEVYEFVAKETEKSLARAEDLWRWMIKVPFTRKSLLVGIGGGVTTDLTCLLYTSPSPRDLSTSRMPSSA